MTNPFKCGHVYRHISALDIEILVLSIGEIVYRPSYCTLTVRYWDPNLLIFQGEDYDTVNVEKEDFWKWKQKF